MRAKGVAGTEKRTLGWVVLYKRRGEVRRQDKRRGVEKRAERIE